MLDIGPGYSRFAAVVAEVTGAHYVTSLDCDKNVLDWQAQILSQKGHQTESIHAFLEIDTIQRIKARFDIILCMEVLEHLSNAEEILPALAELIANNGRIVITVPTKKSERWLRLINPSYMQTGTHHHVQEFDQQRLLDLLESSQLRPIVFIPTQPHYFISHTWLFGTRMQIDESTGRIITGGFRAYVWRFLCLHLFRLFSTFRPAFWGKVFPRNYFVVATRHY